LPATNESSWFAYSKTDSAPRPHVKSISQRNAQLSDGIKWKKTIEIKLAEEEKKSMPAETSSDEILASTWPKSAANPFLCFRFLFFCGLKVDKLLHGTSATGLQVSPQAWDRD
jgi:hypothetical protein